MTQSYRIIQADYLKWLILCNRYGAYENYFHALLSDWTYWLESIQERFGKEGAAPAKPGKDGSFSRQSAGFMGQEWDQPIAYFPQTWKDARHVLKPGALTMGFSHARQWDLLASAQREAGFERNSDLFMQHSNQVALMGWIYGSGKGAGTKVEGMPDYQYGGPFRPAIEPIVISNAPFDEKAKKDVVLNHGTLAYNIEQGREWTTSHRYPTNMIVIHHPECRQVGVKLRKAGGKLEDAEYKADKLDLLSVHECHPDCQYHNFGDNRARFFTQIDWRYEQAEALMMANPTAYAGKVPPSARNAFCEGIPKEWRHRANAGGWSNDPKMAPRKHHNHHPTLKPIALIKYLAELLLPDKRFFPRRILVPCSGTGSEIIGCLLAGWDEVIGVEIMPAYKAISDVRVAGWFNYIKRGQRDVDAIMTAHKKYLDSEKRRKRMAAPAQVNFL